MVTRGILSDFKDNSSIRAIDIVRKQPTVRC